MKLRVPLIYNLRRDPFERADFNSNTYFDWMVDHVPQIYLMQAAVAAQIETSSSSRRARSRLRSTWMRCWRWCRLTAATPEQASQADSSGFPRRTSASVEVCKPKRLATSRSRAREPRRAEVEPQRGRPRLLRTDALSGAADQPRRAPRPLQEPGPPPGGVPSDLARRSRRENHDILIAGCGTSQAARYALREPDARITAIDVSETSLRHTRDLQRKYNLENLELHQLPIERVEGDRPVFRPGRLHRRAASSCPTRTPAFAPFATSCGRAARCA